MRDTHVASSVVDVLRVATDGGARELLRVVLGEAPGAAGGSAVVGAVDGARAAELVGEVVDDSLGWRRNAALAFDETNFDDSVLDMEPRFGRGCRRNPICGPVTHSIRRVPPSPAQPASSL